MPVSVSVFALIAVSIAHVLSAIGACLSDWPMMMMAVVIILNLLAQCGFNIQENPHLLLQARFVVFPLDKGASRSSACSCCVAGVRVFAETSNTHLAKAPSHCEMNLE